MTQRLLDILVSSFPRLVLYCVQVTIPLTVCIYILSLVLGFLLALIQIQKIPVLKQLARVYVWVFRGTPLIVQMYIIFFGLPSLGITLDAFPSAVIAFSLNYAAYMSETIRAAIQSVPEGQWEAGYMIGLSSGQIMLRVILPQAARVAFPTLFSTLIGLTKDSSLAASITVVEMFKAAQQIASRTFEPFALYCEAAFVYLMLNTVLTLLQSVLEKRLAWKQPKGNTAQFPPNGLSTAPADLRAKSRRKASVALRSASLRLGVRHGNCVAKMLDNTQSIICAFGLASAAPCSPYRHLELCGIAQTETRPKTT